MARNEEKAMNLFNKWQTFKTEFHSKSSNRRPLLASECESVGDAEKFRRDILKDLTKKTALIANASLGEFKIRDLNDEINKLLKQKHFWEVRIRELGGGDIIKSKSS
jgi:pre-mRNA-splicing factor ISY1